MIYADRIFLHKCQKPLELKILETVVSTEKLSDAMWKVLSERNYFPVPLSPQKEKKGETNGKWEIIKNMEIESDL